MCVSMLTFSEREEETRGCRNCIPRSLLICTRYQILLPWLEDGEECWVSTWDVRIMRTAFGHKTSNEKTTWKIWFRWKDYIEVDFREIMVVVIGLDLLGSGQGQVAACIEYGNETSGTRLDLPIGYFLLKKYFYPCCLLRKEILWASVINKYLF